MLTDAQVTILCWQLAQDYHKEIMVKRYPSVWGKPWEELTGEDQLYMFHTVQQIVFVVLGVDTALATGKV